MVNRFLFDHWFVSHALPNKALRLVVYELGHGLWLRKVDVRWYLAKRAYIRAIAENYLNHLP